MIPAALVGNAPYTGKYWRDVATTNPGSEPQDPGDGQPVQTSKDTGSDHR